MYPPLSLRRPWTAAFLWCVFSGSVFAQNRIENATRQLEQTDLRARLKTPAQQEITSLYADEDKDVGPQNVIIQKQRHRWIEASTDVQFGSTSNVSLTENAKTESSTMVSTVQVAVTPPTWKIPGGELSTRAGFRYQKFNYGTATGGSESTINDSDFDISTLFVQWRYLYRDKWLATLGLDHNRLLTSTDGSYTEFYSEFAPSISLQRSFELTEKSALAANIGVTGHISYLDPDNTTVTSDYYDRVDQSATVTYIRELLPRFMGQTFYRVQATQYTRNHLRKDVTHSIGVVFSYGLTKDVSVRLFANFEARDSTDVTIADYQKVDTGLGTSLRIQF